ncbi:hypothetical protein OHS33_38920 (plasmid) [Streptomyces sp. NBC_00536]|uniref:hypothetical protein n=1 Tax=Streptomyces sp. NBC_00536 TaxID=2975769 RepID=UPI002E80234B|nr:hypothetical protein [Streptomyces sp. NBC_00536]WUC84331.1 hypothetical protein OHS33_38920 [Streptomyces sp. NBC_00536]
MHDDVLAVHEYETQQFTPAELEAIARYREATAGIPDTFDGFDLAHVHWHVSEFGPTQTYPMIRSLATTLGNWYLALDAAIGDLLTCTTESSTYSTAAARFLKAESETYHQVRQDFEHTVTVWSLGLDTSATGDYPPATRTLNLPGQSLEP